MKKYFKKTFSVIFSFLTFTLFSLTVSAQAPVDFINFEGQLVDTSGSPAVPITDNNVTFKIQVYGPTKASNCLLYEEEHTSIDLSGTNGQFNLPVGSGSTSFTGNRNPGISFSDVFKNNQTFTGQDLSSAPGTTCAFGSISDHESREVIISFSASGGASGTLSPITLGSVSTALYAGESDSVGGLKRSQIAEFGSHIDANMTATNLLKLFDDSDVGALHNHDGRYAKLSGSTSISLGSGQTIGFGQFTTAQETTLTSGLAAGDAGKTWFNSTTNKMMYWDGSAAQEVGSGSGAITSVFGRTGIVTANAGDYTATQITNATAGGIAGTTVQAAINELDSEKLALTGGTMTGTLAMGANKVTSSATPSTGNDLTNKTYVDSSISTAGGSFVAKAGSSMTGTLAMGANKITGLGDPTAAQDAATKTYTDSKLRGSNLPAPSAGQDGQAIKWDNGSGAWVYYTPISAGADNLGNHTATQALSMAGQTIFGNSTVSGNLILDSTSDATKGNIVLNPTSGNVSVGTTSATAKLTLSGDSTKIHHNSYSDTAGGAASIHFNRARGTEAAKAAVSSGDSIGSLNARGWAPDNALSDAAKINFRVDGTPSGGDVPGEIDFLTKENGSSLASRMIIKSNGRIGFGTTAPHSDSLTTFLTQSGQNHSAVFKSNSAKSSVLIDTTSASLESELILRNSFGGTTSSSIAHNPITNSLSLKVNGNQKAFFTNNGEMVINNTSLSSGLQLDVEGRVGATEYCDENGGDCFTAAGISSLGIGETNTGANVGTAGVGVFKQKSSLTLQFKKINSGTGITVTDDTGNNKIDIAVDVGTTANRIVQLDGSARLPAVDGSQLTNLPGANGDIEGITAGTGLTGGGTSGAVSIAVDVGTTANKIVQLDGSARLPAVDGSQLTNLPSSADNLGNHTATQNINLATFKLVGNGGTNGLAIAADGKVGLGTATPANLLHVKTSGADPAIFEANNPNTKIEVKNSSGSAAFGSSGDSLKLDAGANGSEEMIITNDGKVGIGTNSPHSSAILHLDSTTKGFLPPKLTTTQRDAISPITNGLVIFNTTTNALEVSESANWYSLAKEPEVLVISQRVGSGGTEGFCSPSGVKRRLNTQAGQIQGATFSDTNDQFILPAGKYLIEISAPARSVESHTIRLENSGGSTLMFGTLAETDFNGVTTRSKVSGLLELAGPETLQVQHYCESSGNTSALGNNGLSITVDLTHVKIVKIK